MFLGPETGDVEKNVETGDVEKNVEVTKWNKEQANNTTETMRPHAPLFLPFLASSLPLLATCLGLHCPYYNIGPGMKCRCKVSAS